MMCLRFHIILPALFLASAAQPVYRFGAFIETAHAECLVATATIDGAATEVPDAPAERIPERSWPVELVALFPAGIGSSELAFRVQAGGRLTLDADSGASAFCQAETPAACPFTPLVLAEPSGAASIGVVAHPIHIHAPPPKL